MSAVAAGAQPKVWIVLVNWNGWRDTVECLESVLRQDYPAFGVIVCDNASADGSLDQLAQWAEGRLSLAPPDGPLRRLSAPPRDKPVPYLRLAAPAQFDPAALDCPLLLVQTGANLGFAGGNNVGIRMALQDPACGLVWLLNNDTVVEPDCLSRMVATAGSDAAIGITGSVNCFYADPDRVQAVGGGYFSRRRVKTGLYGFRLRYDGLPPALVAQAGRALDWVSGASMLVSRAFLEQVGEMEEQYFLYFEEIDWALRGEGRFRNALAADARLYHKSGSSTGEQDDSAFAVYTQYRSRFKLYRKFMPGWLLACHLRTVRDALVAMLRRRRVAARAMFRAGRDDLFRL
ncbi:glycosyltransferase family 2 protein [Rugamonas sp. A1-17]|nr:glycosyltransferase family 2 protein [Rugamonas sp. A1-17]